MIMMFATPTAPTRGDGAEAEKQAVQGALGGGFGNEGRGWLADDDLAGVFRIGGGGEEVVDGADSARFGEEVNGRRMPV
jgi:hypothetical protein